MKVSKHFTVLLFVMPCLSVQASEVDIPNEFTSGTAAVAAEVNENFTELETGVNDNYSIITAMQSEIATLQSTIQNLESQVQALQAIPASTVAIPLSPRQLESNYDYTMTDGRGVFRVEFNVTMDTTSFAAGTNVFVSGSNGTGTGLITWTDANSTMIFTMDDTFQELSPCFSGGLDLTIKGEGESPVQDSQGKVLDGDKNGLPGGDLVVNYDILC